MSDKPIRYKPGRSAYPFDDPFDDPRVGEVAARPIISFTGLGYPSPAPWGQGQTRLNMHASVSGSPVVVGRIELKYSSALGWQYKGTCLWTGETKVTRSWGTIEAAKRWLKREYLKHLAELEKK